MPKSVNTSNSILALICNATTFTNIAINATSSPLTNLYVSLHTGDPGTGGSQLTNEATFGAYARQAVERTTDGWEVPSSGSTSNAALIQWLECTSGSNVISHVAVGTDLSGAGRVLWAGELSSNRTISSGIQAQFNVNNLVISET